MNRLALPTALLASLLLVGCGGNDEIQLLGPQKLEMSEEQVATIRSLDKQIDDEEGGAQKIVKPTKGTRKSP